MCTYTVAAKKVFKFACLRACGRTSLQRCILFPVGLCSRVHQAGRGLLLGAAGGLLNVGSGLRGRSTQASLITAQMPLFIFRIVQLISVLVSEPLGKSDPLLPLWAELAPSPPLRTGPDRHWKQISRLILYSYSQLRNGGWSLLLLLIFYFLLLSITTITTTTEHVNEEFVILLYKMTKLLLSYTCALVLFSSFY